MVDGCTHGVHAVYTRSPEQEGREGGRKSSRLREASWTAGLGGRRVLSSRLTPHLHPSRPQLLLNCHTSFSRCLLPRPLSENQERGGDACVARRAWLPPGVALQHLAERHVGSDLSWMFYRGTGAALGARQGLAGSALYGELSVTRQFRYYEKIPVLAPWSKRIHLSSSTAVPGCLHSAPWLHPSGLDPDQALCLFLLGSQHCVLAAHLCPQEDYPVGAECCPKCGKGYHVKQACSHWTGTVCVACPPGSYTAHPNGLSQCLPCRPCEPDMGLETWQKCSSTQDTVCHCRQGHFCADGDDEQCLMCLPHTTCSPGQRVLRRGTDKQDTVCDDCPQGTFSPNGTLEQCLPWTKCGCYPLLPLSLTPLSSWLWPGPSLHVHPSVQSVGGEGSRAWDQQNRRHLLLREGLVPLPVFNHPRHCRCDCTSHLPMEEKTQASQRAPPPPPHPPPSGLRLLSAA
ncbi:tumor necrosis factor receptor superfamily member 14 [Thomomys bottae]